MDSLQQRKEGKLKSLRSVFDSYAVGWVWRGRRSFIGRFSMFWIAGLVFVLSVLSGDRDLSLEYLQHWPHDV